MRAWVVALVLVLVSASTQVHGARVIVYHRDHHNDPGNVSSVITRGRHVSLVDKDAPIGPNEAEDSELKLFRTVFDRHPIATHGTTPPTPPPTPLNALTAQLTGSVYRGTAPAYNGSNARVYVIDSGCQVAHPFLAPFFASGQLVLGPSFVPSELDVGTDTLGHGTHVTGIVLQLAPGVRVTCVRVFNKLGGGTSSSLAFAIDWAASVRPPVPSPVAVTDTQPRTAAKPNPPA